VKRFGGTLDLFNHLRVQLVQRPGGAMARLEQSRLVRSFEGLRVRPRAFALGCYLLELLDRLAPEGGARADLGRLFAFALSALATLERREPDARLRTLLELCALDALGLRPELRRCVRCGSDVEGPAVGFSIPDGGPVCAACRTGAPDLLPIHLGTLRALEQGMRLGLERAERLALGPAALEEARRVLGRFERFHVGVELRSQRFLEQILQERRPAAAAPASREPAR
jgi:DNA repair protein RecO (recombination protein O)